MSESYDSLGLELSKCWIEDGIGYWQITRPKAFNAMNGFVTLEGRKVIKLFSEDRDVHTIIIQGDERAFCAGGDIPNMINATAIEALDDIRGIHELCALIYNSKKPVIASGRGLALGGGLEMMLACDIIVLGEGATLGFPEINLGIYPGGSGTQRMARYTSISATKYYIFTGEYFGATEAYRLGIANFVVPDGEVVDKCKAIAQKLQAKSNTALRLAKQCINFGHDLDMKTGCDYEQTAWALLYGTEDQTEGMQAFLDKRKPNFQNK